MICCGIDRPETTPRIRTTVRVALTVGCATLALLLLAPAAGARSKKAEKPTDPDELWNPLLGLEHSHWLLGPVVEIATPEEVRDYLALVTDEEAEAFVETFWEVRADDTPVFSDTPRDVFEARAGEADKRFSEAGRVGHQTDRGVVWVLYGEPEEIGFETPRVLGQPTLEVWRYPDDAEAGLDGETPDSTYRFYRDGNLTVRYNGRVQPNARDRFEAQRRRRQGGFGG